MAGSDLLGGATLIKGTGVATATATLAALAGQRAYVLAASVEVTGGTASLCRLELRDAGTAVYSETYPVPAVGTSTGGQINFPAFVAMTVQNSALTVVATTTGATTTNVYAVVAYGP